MALKHISDGKTTLINFLLHNTSATELVVIRDCGYISATVFIDYEDLWVRYFSNELRQCIVQSDEWGELRIVNKDGSILYLPCHYVDIRTTGTE